MRNEAEQRRRLPCGLRLLGVAVALGSLGCGGGEQKTQTADTPSTAAAPAGAATAAAGSGAELYQRCATCHQATGAGIPGTFPPLAGSEYATAADPSAPILIVLHGMQGPVTVKGTQYNGLMPAYGTGIEMSNEEVAAVLTYVRQSWGNAASAVTPQQVADVRAAARSASGPVTAEELRARM